MLCGLGQKKPWTTTTKKKRRVEPQEADEREGGAWVNGEGEHQQQQMRTETQEREKEESGGAIRRRMIMGSIKKKKQTTESFAFKERNVKTTKMIMCSRHGKEKGGLMKSHWTKCEVSVEFCLRTARLTKKKAACIFLLFFLFNFTATRVCTTTKPLTAQKKKKCTSLYLHTYGQTGTGALSRTSCTRTHAHTYTHTTTSMQNKTRSRRCLLTWSPASTARFLHKHTQLRRSRCP